MIGISYHLILIKTDSYNLEARRDLQEVGVQF